MRAKLEVQKEHLLCDDDGCSGRIGHDNVDEDDAARIRVKVSGKDEIIVINFWFNPPAKRDLKC
jgi:hypothetical protein